jgi:hypothetical protein
MKTVDMRNPAEARELRKSEIDVVAGGMKWTRGTDNTDVIDARGGSIKVLGITITMDVNGNISSIS